MNITDREFEKFSSLVYDRAGINLHIGKKQLVQTRLGKIMRTEGIDNFSSYLDMILRDDSGNRLVELLDAISTNHTYFFREKEHLRWLNEHILPDIFKLESVKQTGQIRIWSAGCSTGEEPYTIAIDMLENYKFPFPVEIKMLATDLSSKVVSIAQNGVYREEKLQNVPKHMITKYFQKGSGSADGLYRVNEDIRRKITFRKFNLMDPFPFKKQFDFIFCRNVMIYFDKQTQQKVVQKFQRYVKPGGYFVVGHSESLSGIKHEFKYIAPTIYRKMT